jgi:hypothetical protein
MIPINQVVEFSCAKIDCEDIPLTDLKMPFNTIFVDFNGSLYDDTFKSPLKAMIIEKAYKGKTDELLYFGVYGITKQSYHRLSDMTYNIERYQPAHEGDTILLESYEEVIQSSHHFTAMGSVLQKLKTIRAIREYAGKQPNEQDKSVSFAMLKIAMGFLLYVNSVNVEIIKKEGEQTKKRRKQNKPIPEPYYWCKLETKEVHVTDSEGSGTKHGYQYDVRGHFKHFKQGKMKGKILWCPPHRRGLANTVYRPKTYNLITK